MKEKKNLNRSILILTYFFIILFLILGGYYGYFIFKDGSKVLNNTYNLRSDVLAETIVRGQILGAGGEVLAETIVNEEGKEERYYPYNSLFSHIVGRTENGRTGIEQLENITLLSSGAPLVTNALLQLKGEKIKGDNVVTTLDVNLQEAAYRALGEDTGVAIVMEPDTGKILAMVSKPDYDPNLISKKWESLNQDTERFPLLNRATLGLYPPGSTFKTITTLAYMREEAKAQKNYEYECRGHGIFSSVSIECYDRKIHGTESLKDSFANSCNTSYANMGLSLDTEAFGKLCREFLFNKTIPTDLITNESIFTLSGESKEEEVPQTAIGQGNTQITPILNCMIAATVANNGVMMTPYVVDYIETSEGYVREQKEPKKYKRLMSKKEAKVLQELMEAVVTQGTGSYLNGASYTVAGKTGSAEFDESKNTHSWFIGYAPADEPEIAICVLVENTGNGDVYSLPVVKEILDAWWNRKNYQ